MNLTPTCPPLPSMHNAAGIRDSDFEEPVANNSTIYAINAVALTSAATIAAFNPSLVRAPHHLCLFTLTYSNKCGMEWHCGTWVE